MTPSRTSRFRWSAMVKDALGQSVLTDPEPFLYQSMPDNVFHTVQQGDTLWGLADYYFEGYDGASNLWWVIADFQPSPLPDPTQTLEVGSILIIPSLRTLSTLIFTDNRSNAAAGVSAAAA